MPPKKARKGGKRKQADGQPSKAEISEGTDSHEDKKTKTASYDDRSSALKWLLSKDAFELANPEIPKGKGETDWDPSDQKKHSPPKDAGKRLDDKSNASVLRYPGSRLTPFQNLVASVLLSKPISHRLGLRTIQTLLNPPFGLRTAKDLDESGYEGRRKVMWEARTQHKEKTAMQLGDLVAGIRALADGKDSGPEVDGLESVRSKAKSARKSSSPSDTAAAISDLLASNIKGVGPTGVGIFLRRVQIDWPEVYPYADEKVLADARKFKLIEDGDGAEALAKVVGGSREDFVRVLDVLIGLELEKKLDEAIENAVA